MPFNRRGFLAALTAGVGGAELSKALPKRGLEPFGMKSDPSEIPLDSQGNIDVNTMISSMVERIQYTYYDRFRLPKGQKLPSQIHLFQVPLNHKDLYTEKYKLPADTNMVSAGRFNPPHDLVLRRHGFVLAEGNEALIRREFSWEMQILMKSYNNGPLLLKDGSCFIDLEDKWLRYIPPLVNFALIINTNNLAGERIDFDLDLVATLSGLTARPVQ